MPKTPVLKAGSMFTQKRQADDILAPAAARRMPALARSTVATHHDGIAALGFMAPGADCPDGGWPLVFLASLEEETVSPTVKHILSNELIRWGLAVAWVDLKADLSDIGSRIREVGNMAISTCRLNSSKFGIAFISSDGVHLTARDVDNSVAEFMEVRADGAPEEIAIWMMEHLWATTVNDATSVQ